MTGTAGLLLAAQLNTAAAFGTLAISDHWGLFSMGVLLELAIVLVMLASLAVLPAVLLSVQHRR